jgi:hypothetical protein
MRKQSNRRTNSLVPAMILVLAGWPAQQLVADEDAVLNDSRELAQSFGTQLQTALKTALARGGPVEAMSVCKDQAPQIAAQLSRESGARVSRTSRQFRNPANSPEPWQIAVLANFESGMTAEDPLPEHLEHHADGIRYMKAIRIQPVCLMCHGTEVTEDVGAALAEHYPHDRARGYALGDLRGAFSISWPAEPEQKPTSPVIE